MYGLVLTIYQDKVQIIENSLFERYLICNTAVSLTLSVRNITIFLLKVKLR
jgi:hypothetical protein